MHRFLPLLIVCLCLASSTAEGKSRPAPGFITTEALHEFDKLEAARKRFIKLGLDEASRLRMGRYIFGSADPRRGGFDCSGAVHYLLKKMGINPPRSSSTMYDWVRASGNLHVVGPDATSLDHRSFRHLKPGDLVFWSGTYRATDGRKNNITHVQIYLGRERDGRHVMLGATDGRSYRGTARCGFGVFDFRLPSRTSKSKFAGYGRPPGL